MRAIILAGGKGTRLRPYTSVIPKPLVPIGEHAIMEILLNQLKRYDVKEVTICVNHFAEIIKAFFGNGEKLGISISYSEEESPLGTVGPIRLVEDLQENFLVMNGDLLTDLNFRALFDHHLQKSANLTVATYRREIKNDFGVITVDDQRNCIKSFQEKPVHAFTVSMGVYVMNKRVVDLIPEGVFGFDDLILKLLDLNEIVRIFPFDGYWLDIGRPDDYEKANQEISIIEGFLL